MKEQIINTIMAVVVVILASLLVYVCDTFTVPAIAT
jgi:preprotein translocase subunit SecE